MARITFYLLTASDDYIEVIGDVSFAIVFDLFCSIEVVKIILPNAPNILNDALVFYGFLVGHRQRREANFLQPLSS
jgi:hypothetical protein